MRRPALRLVRTSSRCLLARAQDDVEVFAEFYDTYYDSVLRFLARRAFDPELAFDLLSETFAKALERRAQFRGSSAAEEQAWLFSIARTELSHYWRSGKVEQAAVERFAITVPTLTESEHDRIEALAGLSAIGSELADALLALPPEQRRAVELRVLDDRSYADIAVELDVSEQTARARVSRGLRALSRAIPQPSANLIGDIA